MTPEERLIITLEKSIREYRIKRKRASKERNYNKVRLLDCLETEACAILNKLKLSNQDWYTFQTEIKNPPKWAE